MLCRPYWLKLFWLKKKIKKYIFHALKTVLIPIPNFKNHLQRCSLWILLSFQWICNIIQMSKMIQNIRDKIKTNIQYLEILLSKDLWDTDSKSQDELSTASIIHVKQSNKKATKFNSCPKKSNSKRNNPEQPDCLPGKSLNKQCLLQGQKAGRLLEPRASCREHTNSLSHLVTQILCKSKSYSIMKGIIPPSSSAVTNVYITSITWPGQPKYKHGYLKKNKNMPNGLWHLNSKLGAERMGKPIHCFLKTSLPLSPPLAGSELKRVTSQGPSTINFCIITSQCNYQCPGQGNPAA